MLNLLRDWCEEGQLCREQGVFDCWLYSFITYCLWISEFFFIYLFYVCLQIFNTLIATVAFSSQRCLQNCNGNADESHAFVKSCLLAGVSLKILNIAFKIASSFQWELCTAVWNALCTLCIPQLPTFKSEQLKSAFNWLFLDSWKEWLTFGPSIEICSISFNLSLFVALLNAWTKSEAQAWPRNSDVRYLVLTWFTSQTLMCTSICFFWKRLCMLSSKHMMNSSFVLRIIWSLK